MFQLKFITKLILSAFVILVVWTIFSYSKTKLNWVAAQGRIIDSRVSGNLHISICKERATRCTSDIGINPDVQRITGYSPVVDIRYTYLFKGILYSNNYKYEEMNVRFESKPSPDFLNDSRHKYFIDSDLNPWRVAFMKEKNISIYINSSHPSESLLASQLSNINQEWKILLIADAVLLAAGIFMQLNKKV